MKRRSFIQSVSLAALYAQLPFWIRCSNPSEKKLNNYLNQLADYEPLTEHQAKTAASVQQILFPDSEEIPGAIAINAFPFFIWILNDKYRDEAENRYLINGLNKLNDFSNEKQNKNFWQISLDNKKEILLNYIEEKGDSWLSSMFSVVLEALFANPVYGSNPGEIGWKWLNYTPGFPQPTEKNKYPHIMEKRTKEKIIFTHLEQLKND
ncbi:MAG: gluconate 2-dehydrogenase subunit 3 family protein [Bacteroidetes bacterium]|nr:MAG: gluconate 2-dehydrogenase subunit 3 family protein [Bacteroidota bacterium]